MSVAITIEPFSTSLDMYDAPDPSTAYSLSGHVLVKFRPSGSMFGLSRSSASPKLTLTSLELTFEGQTELILKELGYTALRLITITKELVSQPIHISADDDAAEWRIVFNLPVPGWLPATSDFGDDPQQHPAGVTYALYATAHFVSGSDRRAVVRSSSKDRAINADIVPIYISRFVSYAEDEPFPPVFPSNGYAVQARPDPKTATSIPEPILRSLQMTAQLPTRTSVFDKTVPLTVRMKSNIPDLATRRRIHVIGFEADIMQLERYNTSPSSNYVSRFPVPRPSKQPPTVPLLCPHPVSNLVNIGLMKTPPPGQHIFRQHSLMVDDSSRLFKARAADGGDGGVSLEEGWVRMDVDVPVLPDLPNKSPGVMKRPSEQSPLFEARHELRVRVTFGYDHYGSRSSRPVRLFDELVFTVPMEFVNVLPPGPSPHSTPFFPVAAQIHSRSQPDPYSSVSPSHVRSSSSTSKPGRAPMPLPAYNQLYYENGDRKDEMLGALPVYQKEDSSSRVLLHGSPTSLSSSSSRSSYGYVRGSPLSSSPPSSSESSHLYPSSSSRTTPSPPGLRGLGESLRKLKIGGGRSTREADDYSSRRTGGGLPSSMARYSSSGKRQ